MTSTEEQPITEAWTRPVEQLVLPALESRMRVMGFTSPEVGAGVTTLCHAAAETLARSGARVLLIDFSGEPTADGGVAWAPGDSNAASLLRRHPAGYDVLPVIVTSHTRFLFNNAKRLRQALSEELSDYGAILLDLPPLLDERSDNVNPTAVALVCDQVLLVCASQRTTRPSARAAADAARAAGVKIEGIVWNNFGTLSLGRDMARSARKVFWVVPGLSRWLERKLTRSTFLNG